MHWKLQLKCLQIKSVPWNSVFSGHLDVKKEKQHIFPINKQECGLFLFDSLLRKENEIYSNENKRIERVVSIKFLFIIIGYLYIYPNVGNEATLIVTKRLHCYTKVSLKFNVMFSKLVAIFFSFLSSLSTTILFQSIKW